MGETGTGEYMRHSIIRSGDMTVEAKGNRVWINGKEINSGDSNSIEYRTHKCWLISCFAWGVFIGALICKW